MQADPNGEVTTALWVDTPTITTLISLTIVSRKASKCVHVGLNYLSRAGTVCMFPLTHKYHYKSLLP